MSKYLLKKSSENCKKKKNKIINKILDDYITSLIRK